MFVEIIKTDVPVRAGRSCFFHRTLIRMARVSAVEVTMRVNKSKSSLPLRVCHALLSSDFIASLSACMKLGITFPNRYASSMATIIPMINDNVIIFIFGVLFPDAMESL